MRGWRGLLAILVAGGALFALVAVVTVLVAWLGQEGAPPTAVYFSEGDPDVPLQKNSRTLPDGQARALGIEVVYTRAALEEAVGAETRGVIVTAVTAPHVDAGWLRARWQEGVVVIGLDVPAPDVAVLLALTGVEAPEPPAGGRFFSAARLEGGKASVSSERFVDAERFGLWLEENLPPRGASAATGTPG